MKKIPLIIVGEADVVEVYDHARSEPWQNLQHQIVDVTARSDGVTRIDEEQIVLFEFRKGLDGH